MDRKNTQRLGLGINCVVQPSVVLATLSLLLCSCDPGMHAAPVGWSKVDDRTFEKKIDGLQYRTTRIGGLIGESWLHVDFIISNAAEPAIAKRFLLIGPMGRIEGKQSKGPYSFTNAQIRGPQMRYMGAYWEFDRNTDLPKIIGNGVVIEATFLYGSQERTIQVKFQK